MGEPLSPFLVKKLNYNYDSSVSGINDAIKALDKKKGFRDTKAAHRNQALKSLLFYSPESEVSHSTAPLIVHTDKITQRLAYYHLNGSKDLLPDDALYEQMINAELNDKAIVRKILCLRTFSHLVSSNSNAAKEINRYIESILEEPTEISSKKKEAKKVTKDSATRHVIQFAGLLALRQLETDISASMYNLIINVIEQSDYPVAVRHALALIHSYVSKAGNVMTAASGLRSFMPNHPPSQAPVKSMFSEDFLARVYLVRTFSVFTVAEEAKGYSNDYYEAIGHLICDYSSRVSFEAIKKLSQLGWSRLHHGKITIREGLDYLRPVEETSILQRAIKRLISEIYENIPQTRKSQCLMHAALRCVIMLGQTYVSSDDASIHDKENPLSSLFEPMQKVLPMCQDIIRLKVLIAFVWTVQPYEEEIVSSIFEKEVQLDTLTASMYTELLRALHERIIVSPAMASIALHLIFIISTRRAEKAPLKPIAQLWTTIIKVSIKGKELVQANIFSVLDHQYAVEERRFCNEIHRLAFYVLGREALNISCRDAPVCLETPYFRSILLRLEDAALHGTWEIQNVCTDGLIKIAFVSGNLDIRKHLLHFLETSDIACMNPFVDGFIATIEEVVVAQEKWVALASESEDGLTDEQKALLKEDNQALFETASCFCTLKGKYCSPSFLLLCTHCYEAKQPLIVV